MVRVTLANLAKLTLQIPKRVKIPSPKKVWQTPGESSGLFFHPSITLYTDFSLLLAYHI